MVGEPSKTGERAATAPGAASEGAPLPPLLEGRTPFEALVELMAQLRTPVSGCPWDLEQTFETIAPYTIEEAYEVADAIERRDMTSLREELGDLLFQSVFHARMAEEAGAFTIEDVVRTLVEKMVERHPHVFGPSSDKAAVIRDAADQTSAWEVMKAAERAKKQAGLTGRPSALDGVALALPALMRAEKLTRRAARVGFDWPDAEQVLDKLDEEVGELREAMASKDQAHIEEEVGDLLFVCANLCRKLGVDAEVALRKANAKFEKRFACMEELSAQDGDAFERLSLDQQEALWARAKQRLKP